MGPVVGEMVHVRESWAIVANPALEQAQVASRIGHRSLQAQGIDREPGPHIPRAAFEMERHGYYSVVAELIRAEHQARVDARLERAAETRPPAAEPKSPEEIQQESIENWRRYRQAQLQVQPEAAPAESAKRTRNH